MSVQRDRVDGPAEQPPRPGRVLLRGVGVGRSGVVGPVVTVAAAPAAPDDEPGTPSDQVDAVQATVADAFAAVAGDLRAQSDLAEGAAADVLAATAQMADDSALRERTAERISAGDGPVTALDAAIGGFTTMFEHAGGYLAERVTDLRGVRDRVAARILGVPVPGVPTLTARAVVVARDLAPADTAALDVTKVLAIVTELGGPTSHTAVIAGQLGIPCVVRVAGAGGLDDGDVVAVDAAAGTVEVDPAPEVAASFARRADAAQRLAADTAPGVTADGRPVQLLANVGTADDADRAAMQAVEGSGLFRTEVLFLGRDTAPARAEQTAVYARVLRAFGDRKVVVRTLDAGADKPLTFATRPDEENPALGVRGYRLVRSVPEVVATQLAALADAQRQTGIEPWVMAPMISTPAEAHDFAAAARAEGLAQVGVMVEVPSAALRIESVLAEVDFVSIGSNDLAQYTMATDRLRGELTDLIDKWQPAVLDLVAMTAATGEMVGKPVGVCGESAADPLMAVVLVGLGVTSLSMTPAAVPAVRFAVKAHTYDQARAVAWAALGADDAAGARAAARAALMAGVADTLGL